MQTIENLAARAEQFLNPIDWIPLISCVSGTLRILLGAIEAAAGVAFAAYKIFHIFLGKEETFYSAFRCGTCYWTHGIGNIVRGYFAVIPLLNLSLYFYDQHIGRYNYPREIMRKGVYPLATAHRLVRY